MAFHPFREKWHPREHAKHSAESIAVLLHLFLSRFSTLKLGLAFISLPLCAAASSAPSDSRVVTVFVGDAGTKITSRGVGFFVSENGLLVTSRHLVQGTFYAVVHTADGVDLPVKGFVAEDPNHDLVLLKVDVNGSPFFRLGSLRELKVGQNATLIADSYGFKGIRIKGKILLIELLAGEYDWIALNLHVESGMSGSPVCDDRDLLIGAMTGQTTEGKMTFVNSVESVRQLTNKASRHPRPLNELSDREYFEMYNDRDFKASLEAFERKDSKAALGFIKETLIRFPLSPAAHVLQGTFYSNLGAMKDAESSYRNAVSLKSDYALAWSYLGATLGLQKKFEEGLSASEKAVSLDPTLIDAWTNLVGSYIINRRYNDARSALGRLRSSDAAGARATADRLEKALEAQSAKDKSRN